MSKDIIRLGDPTSHGGSVVAVSARHFTVDGLPVARVGNLAAPEVKRLAISKLATVPLTASRPGLTRP
jgi:uncharacterized Zn-binding protein involved in type VI secretion